MAKDPSAINRRSGDWQVTPLHQAVERNNADLVRHLLAFKPDLSVKDSAFHSTPLGWAKHFGHAEIEALLESAMMDERAKAEGQIEK